MLAKEKYVTARAHAGARAKSAAPNRHMRRTSADDMRGSRRCLRVKEVSMMPPFIYGMRHAAERRCPVRGGNENHEVRTRLCAAGARRAQGTARHALELCAMMPLIAPLKIMSLLPVPARKRKCRATITRLSRGFKDPR